jgi:hypothetical protein
MTGYSILILSTDRSLFSYCSTLFHLWISRFVSIDEVFAPVIAACRLDAEGWATFPKEG